MLAEITLMYLRSFGRWTKNARPIRGGSPEYNMPANPVKESEYRSKKDCFPDDLG